jgi:hypothetical protein
MAGCNIAMTVFIVDFFQLKSCVPPTIPDFKSVSGSNCAQTIGGSEILNIGSKHTCLSDFFVYK